MEMPCILNQEVLGILLTWKISKDVFYTLGAIFILFLIPLWNRFPNHHQWCFKITGKNDGWSSSNFLWMCFLQHLNITFYVIWRPLVYYHLLNYHQVCIKVMEKWRDEAISNIFGDIHSLKFFEKSYFLLFLCVLILINQVT